MNKSYIQRESNRSQFQSMEQGESISIVSGAGRRFTLLDWAIHFAISVNIAVSGLILAYVLFR